MGKLLFASALAALSMTVAGAAHATLLGGPVPNTTFGGSTSYSYVGTSIAPFTQSGGGTMQLAISTFGDSFGTSQVDQSGQTTIFTNNDTVGTTRAIAPGYSPFLLYFKTVGTRQLAGCDPSTGSDCAATLFSNGTTSGEAGGNDGGQSNLAIYYALATNTYALFFDDGGPAGLANNTPIDDNDYNDLVVTYTPTATTVPEPLSIGLLGSAIAGLGLTRLRLRRSRKAFC